VAIEWQNDYKSSEVWRIWLPEAEAFFVGLMCDVSLSYKLTTTNAVM